MLAVSIVVCCIIRCTTKVSKPPESMMIVPFLFFGFVMSILWVWFTANLLIDLLNLFGVMSGINSSLLGLTVLAWGNSTGDLMANISIAKKGFVEMAMTGCYAGPLFNLLMGIGISTFKLNISNTSSSIDFSIKDTATRIPLILMIGITFSMITALIWTAAN